MPAHRFHLTHSLTRPVILALAVLVMVAAGPQGHAAEPSPRKPGVVGEDNRVMLDPTRWPWTMLARINREGRGFCTGAVVDERVVLTADHCLYHFRSGQLLEPKRIDVLVALRRGEWRVHARGERFVRPEGARNRRANQEPSIADDWALIVLDRPVSGPPLPIRRLPSKRSSGADGGRMQIVVAGYGYDRPHLLSIDDDCSATRDRRHPGVVNHTCDAVPGASGAPILMKDTRGFAVVGIVSGYRQRGNETEPFAADTSAALKALRVLKREIGTRGR